MARNFITSILRSVDSYGKPMLLNHKNSSTFNTAFGGLLTVCCWIGILIYLVIELISVINRSSIALTTSLNQRNLLFDNSSITLNSTNFDIAVHLELFVGSLPNDTEIDQYFNIKISQIYSDSNDTNGVGISTSSWVENYYDMEMCTTDSFINESITTGSMKQLEGYWCPKNFSTTLFGHMMGNSR